MRVSIQKCGNSLAVRIPKPVAGKRYTLEQLLAGVKKENLHEEVDTGKPVGRELW
jgi:antitoxin MazE